LEGITVHETRTATLATTPAAPTSPTPPATLCVHSKAARAAAYVHTREFVENTTPEAPDVPADRDHHISITVWTACTCCSGGAQ
jgi:hypothetical protein